MGAKNQKSSNENSIDKKNFFKRREKVSKNSFEYLSIIGKGGFGKVWKVFEKSKKIQYALKEMSKSKILDKRSDRSVKYERDLLSRINHPFIINMHYAFQDNDNLYIIMDLLTGGDLRYHICKQKKFTEAQTQFFMACIILGLEYCHTNNVVHRDIKPENLVLDSNGYVKITDFGVAKVTHNKIVSSSETSGTPGYMAPEVMCSQNHSYAADYFALGIIGYEFMNGKRPYLGKNRKEIKEKIMARQAQVKIEDKPSEWSVESVDCINRLLQRKPHLRLGSRGAAEVKEHSWFKYYPWKDVYLKKFDSPFIPRQGDNYDYKYCNKPDRIGLTTQERYIAIVNSSTYNTIFKEFYYFNRDEEENENENSNYNLRKFKNPHLVYYEEIEGNSNENDAAISNRNILRKAIDEQIYTEIKKNPVGGPFTLYKLYSNNNNKNIGKKNNSMTLSKGIFRNDSSMNNSSYRSKKTSKASGFGY